jgi:hypothetical protein
LPKWLHQVIVENTLNAAKQNQELQAPQPMAHSGFDDLIWELPASIVEGKSINLNYNLLKSMV